jgi:hypothetical protein
MVHADMIRRASILARFNSADPRNRTDGLSIAQNIGELR